MSQNVEYFIAKGFDRETAEYFASGRRSILKVEIYNNQNLLITFDNNEQRIFNISKIMEKGGAFAFLNDPANFKRVYIDDNGDIAWDIDPEKDSSTDWNNTVDICSDSCYLESVPLYT